jgi:hypothetical protein
MVMTDPIADMLTRIRNANNAKHPNVTVPSSNIKKAIADIMLEEGYIKDVQYIEDTKQGILEITLKYGENDSKVISGLKRISKPGLRIICVQGRSAEGAQRPWRRRHLDFERRYDGQKRPQAERRRRSALLHLVDRQRRFKEAYNVKNRKNACSYPRRRGS